MPMGIAPPTALGALRGLWLLTWKGRLTLRQLPALLGTVLAVPLLALVAMHKAPAHATPIFYWLVVFHLQLALPFYCLTIFGDLIRGELQANTLVFCTVRPLTRARLFLVKFLCQMGWVQIVALVNGILLLGIGVVGGVEDVVHFAPLFFGVQCLAVLAYGACSAFLGLVHKRFLVLGVLYGAIVEVGIGQIPSNINSLSLTRHLKTLLANNGYFSQTFEWSAQGTAFSVAALMLGAVLFLAWGAVLFTFCEYHHTQEMQK